MSDDETICPLCNRRITPRCVCGCEFGIFNTSLLPGEAELFRKYGKPNAPPAKRVKSRVIERLSPHAGTKG